MADQVSHGVNLGDVIAEADDIFGDGVNVAARLEALAEPGGICVSRMVRDNVRDKLEYTFQPKALIFAICRRIALPAGGRKAHY